VENAHFVEVERHPLYTRICACARDLWSGGGNCPWQCRTL